MPLSPDRLLHAYRQMKTIREFEERLHVEIQTGEIPGFTHLYSGQEAVAVGVCEHLGDADWIASTHRGHGHCIAKGCDVPGMMLEIYGRRDGLCKGKGGSMHIADMSKGMLGANAIVGGGPPIAVGAAIACKARRDGKVAVAFGGRCGRFLAVMRCSSKRGRRSFLAAADPDSLAEHAVYLRVGYRECFIGIRQTMSPSD